MELTLAQQLWLSSPFIILSLGAFALLLIDVLLKRSWPRAEFSGMCIILALLAAYAQRADFIAGRTIFSGFLYADPFALFVTIVILAGSLLALLLGMEKTRLEGVEAEGEFYALFLISAGGALLLATAAEFVMLFLALEIMSMALYAMCGSATGIRRSAEAALKYFFLGSFSSAFLLYGVAILYGITGSTSLAVLGQSLSYPVITLSVVGMGLVLFGLVFKIAAVPFHFWAPDVYEGAPTPVTAYMACVIKTAAVVVGLRVMWGAFGNIFIEWSGAVWTMAALTMLFGNVVALRQRSVKRMLAYSSIAHAGYLMITFLVPGAEFGGGAAALYYLIAYTLMTLGAFGVVLALCSHRVGEPRGDDISNFNGLGYTKPWLAAAMSLFLLSLAGIPPGMAGLLGKFYVFSSAIKAGYVGLAILGVIGSAISCYYYLRVIVAMYFVEADEEARSSAAQVYVGGALAGVLTFCAVLVVALGLMPSLIYDLAAQVARTI